MSWGKVTLLWKHVLANLTATSEATGYPVSNILARREGSYWKATSSANQNITQDSGSALVSSFLTSVFDASATAIQDIAFAPNGTLWVCDSPTKKIYNIKQDGTLITSFLTSVFDASATSTAGITYALNGTLWVCDSDSKKIYNIEQDGTLISSLDISGFAPFPRGITFAKNGTLWVCDVTSLAIYNIRQDGTKITSFETSAFDESATSPSGISYMDDNTLYVCDLSTSKVYNIKQDGTKITSFETSIFDPSATFITGVSYAPDGTLWTCDAVTDKIYNVSPLLSADYLFISGHNLNTIQAKVVLQYSDDNFVSDINNASYEFTPQNDKTLAILFNMRTDRYWRLKLTEMSDIPQIAIAYWGLKTDIALCTASLDPSKRKTKSNIKKTQKGIISGIHHKYRERGSITYDFGKIDADGAEYVALNEWDLNIGQALFGLMWEPISHPSEVYLMHDEKGDFNMPLVKGGNYRRAKLTLTGRMEE